MKTNSGGWGTARIAKTNRCHPERRHYAKELCRECYRNSPHMQEKRREYYKAHPSRFERYTELSRARRRREHKRYGIPPEEQERMLAEQRGLCAICGNPPKRKRLAIDHCHKTGKVRGFLCNACNGALGLLKDDPNLCEAVAAYLRYHSVHAEEVSA